MPVLETHGHWKVGIYEVVQSVAASLLMLRTKGKTVQIVLKTYHKCRDLIHSGLWHALEN